MRWFERMVKVIELSTESLYGIGAPDAPAWKLLQEVLKYYNLADKVVLLINDSPDVGRTVVVNKLNIDEEKLLNSDEYDFLENCKEVKELENAVVVRFSDGYELAQAVLTNVEEDCLSSEEGLKMEAIRKAAEERTLFELLHEAIDEVIDYDDFSDVELARLGNYFIVHNLHSPDAPNVVKIFESHIEAVKEFEEWTKAYAVRN
ncbi:MAG: hypothetical protein QXM08_04035 [Thermofilaceae archaeon]